MRIFERTLVGGETIRFIWKMNDADLGFVLTSRKEWNEQVYGSNFELIADFVSLADGTFPDMFSYICFFTIVKSCSRVEEFL